LGEDLAFTFVMLVSAIVVPPDWQLFAI